MQKQESILYISFNQDSSCMAVGTQRGFKIYKTTNFSLIFSRDFGAGIGIIQMYYKTNLVAIVGGGRIPKYPRNKVLIWDDCNLIQQAQLKTIAQANCKGDVLGVGIKHDRIIVVLDIKVHILNLSDLQVIDIIQTCPNPRGLLAYTTETIGLIVATPSKTLGSILVSTYQQSTQTILIKGHQSTICFITLNTDGKLMATASEKGTKIKVYLTQDGRKVKQLRRGSDIAYIYRICFDKTSQWLACSSDSGTVHIFNITNDQDENKNKKSKFQFLKVISSYFESQWSSCQYRLTDKQPKVTFLPQSNLLGIATLSNYHIVQMGQGYGQLNQKKIYSLSQ